MLHVFDRKPRILWVFRHRTARYEEVNALQQAGAEVIPIAGELEAFPNAVQLNEGSDPWYPKWRHACTIADQDLRAIREFDYFQDQDSIPGNIISALNRWIDIIIVGTLSRLTLTFIRSFRGTVVLRPYGGYPYTAALGPWPIRNRALNRFAASDRYIWCPSLPYLGIVEDPRLTRNELFWGPTVTKARLGHSWKAERSDAVACEVISLIQRYRGKTYQQFMNNYGDLPLRIYGQNPRNGELGDQLEIVGTLSDNDYYEGLASCRLMIYEGLASKYHLHYHPLEALMMGVPVLFFRNSGLAHMALYSGMSLVELRAAGMCETVSEARAVASHLLQDPEAAALMSALQEPIRSIFRPEDWQTVISGLIEKVSRKQAYMEFHFEPDTNKSPYRRLVQTAKDFVIGMRAYMD